MTDSGGAEGVAGIGPLLRLVPDLPGLGDPPAGWPEWPSAAWRRLCSVAPWLRQSDRALMQDYVQLLALHRAAYEWLRVEADGLADDGEDSPRVQLAETGDRLLRIEQRYGMTPADRSRIVGGA